MERAHTHIYPCSLYQIISMTLFRAHLHLAEDFEPVQAAPDVGFWQELSQRKLDVWRSLAFKLVDCHWCT